MNDRYRNQKHLEQQREMGRFPWRNETWGSFIDRRTKEDEQARRCAFRVALFLAGMIFAVWAVEQVLQTAILM